MIQNERELEEALSRPSEALAGFIKQIESPLLLVGAGGKMGPTIGVMARRAAEAGSHKLEVIAGSRFSDERGRRLLEEQGVKTVAVDLLERDSVAKLPEAANVIYLAGLKFGTATNPSLTWAVNTIAPAHLAERYPSARIVALSTGNVYPLVPVDSGGAREDHSLTPLGEYGNAAIARERVFEYFSRRNGTPMALLRLNYAVELRYGVLLEIAQKVWTGQAIDVTQGYFNCIWQRDANELVIRALGLAAAPAQAWNLTGAEILAVRQVAGRFAELLGKQAVITGTEASTALLNNAARLHQELRPVLKPVEETIEEIANWLKVGGRLLNKPTKFEVRDGSF